MSEIVVLQHGESRVSVALLGAELRSWSVAGRPMLWTPDPQVWPETAPLLFPVVGWTRGGTVKVYGRSYPLGLHGFARTSPFRRVDGGADWIRLRLDSNPETRAVYPFAFTFEVTYRLSEAALRTDIVVVNRDGAAIPYACGLHPGFCWPFAGGNPEDYAVTFEEPERPDVPVISADGLFTRERRSVPLAGRDLPLSQALLAQEALCFLHARSRSLRFVHREGAALEIKLEGFPHIALWSRPAGRYLAIEAWTGHGDLVDSDGDLWRKPSMIALQPGERGSHAATYRFVPQGAMGNSFPTVRPTNFSGTG